MNEPLKCPLCGYLLVKIHDKQDSDCAYECFTLECRGDRLEAPVFYGYTQKDIDNNIVEGKISTLKRYGFSYE